MAENTPSLPTELIAKILEQYLIDAYHEDVQTLEDVAGAKHHAALKEVPGLLSWPGAQSAFKVVREKLPSSSAGNLKMSVPYGPNQFVSYLLDLPEEQPALDQVTVQYPGEVLKVLSVSRSFARLVATIVASQASAIVTPTEEASASLTEHENKLMGFEHLEAMVELAYRYRVQLVMNRTVFEVRMRVETLMI